MHVIRRLICQFTHSSDFKPQEEETKENSICYSCAVLAHTQSIRAAQLIEFLIAITIMDATIT